MTVWYDISPAEAVDIDCTLRPDLSPPKNEIGEVCPWPWEPQQLVCAPLGQYRCPYCEAMCVAGVRHPDYSDWVDGCPPGYPPEVEATT